MSKNCDQHNNDLDCGSDSGSLYPNDIGIEPVPTGQIEVVDVYEPVEHEKTTKVEIPENRVAYVVNKDGFFDKLLNTVIEGLDKFLSSRIVRASSNTLSVVFPIYGNIADSVLDAVRNSLDTNLKQKSNNMSKIKSWAKKAKDFLKQPSTQAALGLILTILGAFWAGVDFSAEALTQSVVGVITAVVAVYTAGLQAYNLFRNENKK